MKFLRTVAIILQEYSMVIETLSIVMTILLAGIGSLFIITIFYGDSQSISSYVMSVKEKLSPFQSDSLRALGSFFLAILAPLFYLVYFVKGIIKIVRITRPLSEPTNKHE